MCNRSKRQPPYIGFYSLQAGADVVGSYSFNVGGIRLLTEADYRRISCNLAALKFEWSGLRFAHYARKYDSNQPRVPAGSPDGGRWTSGGASDQSDDIRDLIEPIFAPAVVPPAVIAIESALSLFAALLALNSANNRAIFEFNARGFDRDESGAADIANAQLLNREEVNAACPRLNEVQLRTDFAAASVRREDYDRPSEYGTAVHTNLKRQIAALDDPNFRGEVSVLKTIEASYGERDSIRIDVFERLGNGTVCVYDIKTGKEGLSPARFAEITRRVFKVFPDTTRIIISEIRPTR